MNVAEVEARLDMTRANIRYYEKEGLLSPQRSSNGYRVYGEGDVDTLRKIQLLRRLHLSVEDIGRVQRGELSLAAALERQAETLDRDLAEREKARRICAELRRAGADYATLDAEKYLGEIAAPEEREGGYFALPADALPMVFSPWRRFLAWWLDLSLCGAAWAALVALVMRWNQGSGLLVSLINTYVELGLLQVLEPLLLSTWGYTPGKWIFGLRVRNAAGEKLSYSAAFARTAGRFARGTGYGLPIYNLVRMYQSYKACGAGEVLDWDGDAAYTQKDARPLRGVGMAAALAASWLLVFFIAAQSVLPPNRGVLTPAEYAANVNDLGRYLGVLSDTSLDETGHWVEDARGAAIHINLSTVDTPDLQYTVEDGAVTAVRMELETTAGGVVSGMAGIKGLLVLSYLGAQPGVNPFRPIPTDMARAIDEGFSDFDLTANGVRVRSEVEYSGYMDAGAVLFSEEGAQTRLHMVFTIEKEDAAG